MQRRRFLLGVTAAGTLLAGCSGGTTTSDRESESGPATGTGNATGKSNTTATAGGETAYSVSMAPMGKVTFERVPEKLFAVFPQYADMSLALGRGDAVNAVYVPEMTGTMLNHYCERLDGVSFASKNLLDPLTDGLAKEQLYQLDSDVHFVDPAYVSTQDGWSQSDIEAVGEDIAPWFGNFYSGTHATPPAYANQYEYYGLWELFGKVARVLRAKERYEALNRIHENVLSTIETRLPPKSERPTAVRVTLNEEQFYTYHLNKPGYWLADTRPLGANDAFASREWSDLWGTVGYEAMLEADPDVILHLWGMTPSYDMAEVRSNLESHSIGKQLTAVKNDRIYAHGMRYQGPIMNLFQLEMTAKQLYPEQFGEWPRYRDGNPYPEIPLKERLFDREKVARIVSGDG